MPDQHYIHTLEDAAEARVRDFAGDRDAPLRIGQPTPRELAALQRVYGERIAEARTIAGMLTCELASHLGIGHARMLDIERGGAGDVPAWLLMRVSIITGCRMEFLAGLSGESEHGEAADLREIIMPILLHADTERAMHALEMTRQRALVGSLLDAASTAREALGRVVELNPEAWQGMRGGSSLAAAVDACLTTARRAIPCQEAGA